MRNSIFVKKFENGQKLRRIELITDDPLREEKLKSLQVSAPEYLIIEGMIIQQESVIVSRLERMKTKKTQSWRGTIC